MDERYSRQMLLPEIGSEGQRRLQNSSALIVGLGGLGSPVALYLAGGGVGHIGLCDADRVSLSNLHRQILYSDADVGEPKADAARGRLSRLNSESQFSLFPGGLTESNAESIITGFDLVVDCCDNYATRYLVDDACRRLRKPWVYSTVAGFNAMVALFTPDSAVRYSDLFPFSDGLAAHPPGQAGILSAAPGVVGSIAALEALRFLAGSATPLKSKMLNINLSTLNFSTVSL